jgi:hypothetical protein
MSYQVSYIDTSPNASGERLTQGIARTEDYPSEPAALARARELLEDVHCHRVLVCDGEGEPVGGVCLHAKLCLTGE